jgi:uncharacterized protein (AIM24 family)
MAIFKKLTKPFYPIIPTFDSMKKIVLAPLVIAILATSCIFDESRHIKGNGHVVSEDRNEKNFTGVQLSSSYDVYLTEGSSFAVKVEGEENILPHVKTRVENGQLIIGTENLISINTRREVKVYVTAPSFEKIYLTGSGDITGQTKLTNSSRFDLDVTGSGDMKLELDAPSIKANVTGSGDMQLSGETKQFNYKSSGSGDIKAHDLKSEETTVHLTGSGDARVFSSVKLEVSITGSGDVYYKGEGQVNMHISGSGDVRKVD